MKLVMDNLIGKREKRRRGKGEKEGRERRE